ncbi:MAG TPA: hypothetical protein VNT23_07745 [Gaiellaceae bacterium]|nr:hypothetical protein [Gaiellaceae bacterium]
MRSHLVRLALTLAALALLAGCGSSSSTQAQATDPAPPSADPHGIPLPLHARVVLLSTVSLPPSPGERLLNARLESGELPAAETAATVLTDTDCTPDAQGVSHCRNELRLADGSILVARHSHRMAGVPCLAPGEEVRVRPV